MPPRFSPSTARVVPGSPFLTSIALREDRVVPGMHPFDIPILSDGLSLTLSSPVTFLVGENGSGKSTLLEALAWSVGFGAQGGSRDHHFSVLLNLDSEAEPPGPFTEDVDGHALGRALRLGWRQRSTSGFFLRAETFFNFSSYLESVGSTFERYGGGSFHSKSHGEAFLALFENRFEDGLYILDEPEAALSPQRQLAFLRILHELTAPRIAQFVIATHSPILLAFPGATVLSLDSGRIVQVDYRDTEHYRLTRDFLEAPERFFRYLFDEPRIDADDPG
jgi:predicted ATPase